MGVYGEAELSVSEVNVNVQSGVVFLSRSVRDTFVRERDIILIILCGTRLSGNLHVSVARERDIYKLCGAHLCGHGISHLTPLEPQSRFGDKLLKKLSGLSPKRDCGSKRVKHGTTGLSRIPHKTAGKVPRNAQFFCCC